MFFLLDTIINFVLLIIDTLLKGYRVLLGLIALGLIVMGLLWVAPLFVEVNVSYPFPACDVYWNYPIYARITGSNRLILRAKEEGIDFSAEEGNYLVILSKPVDLDPGNPIKKKSYEFQVAPSSLWQIPPEKGKIIVTSTTSERSCELEFGLNWWVVAFRFVGAILIVIPASFLIKVVFG